MEMMLMGICSGMTFGQADFRRGDVNADGFFDIGDSTYVFRYLFIGNPPPSCMDTADMNDDSTINLTDGVLGLNYLFLVFLLLFF